MCVSEDGHVAAQTATHSSCVCTRHRGVFLFHFVSFFELTRPAGCCTNHLSFKTGTMLSNQHHISTQHMHVSMPCMSVWCWHCPPAFLSRSPTCATGHMATTTYIGSQGLGLWLDSIHYRWARVRVQVSEGGGASPVSLSVHPVAVLMLTVLHRRA